MTELARWANFYVIVSTSAGALIGLQFVVMALVADLPRTSAQAQSWPRFCHTKHHSFRDSAVALRCRALPGGR